MSATERQHLSFDFSHLTEDDYTFNCAMASLPLRRHDAESRRVARQARPLLRLFRDEHLTHYIETELPSDAIALMYVTRRVEVDGFAFDAPVHLGIHVPDAGREAALARSGEFAREGELHPKLRYHEVEREQFAAVFGSSAKPQFPPHVHSFQEATEAATALLFHHPNLINLSTKEGGVVPAHIINYCITPALMQTMDLIAVIFQQGDGWLETHPIPNAKTTSVRPSAPVLRVVGGALKIALRLSQNDPALEGEQWNRAYSHTASDYSATSHHGKRAAFASFAAGAGTGEHWTAASKTSTHGLDVDDVRYTPPSTVDQWEGHGFWSYDDPDPKTKFNAGDAAKLRAGKMSVVITTPDQPQGKLVAPLVPGPADAHGAIPLTATFAGTGTAAGTFSLNSAGTALSYSLTASGIGTNAAAQFEADGKVLHEIVLSNTSGMGRLTITCYNRWLRHLSACVQYLDSAGNVLPIPDAVPEKIPRWLRDTFEPDPTKRFVELVSPVITVFGVPLPAEATEIAVPVWEEVSTVRFLWGGLGRGKYDTAVCPIGITVTALAEMALPVFILGVGTAIRDSGPVRSLMKDKGVLFAVCVAGTFLVAGPTAAYIATAQDPGRATTDLAGRFGPLLLSPATSLGLWVAEKIVQGTAERAAPFVDIALAIINAAVTAAELSETTVAVLESPFVYETDVVRSMQLEIELVPDHHFNKFPDYHDHFQINVVYDSGATLPVYSEALPVTTLSDPIHVVFRNVPAGGRLRVFAFFYAPNGWQSGQAVTGWMEAVGTDGVLSIKGLEITTNEIPLNKDSIYKHWEKIALVDGQLNWVGAVGTPPQQTSKSPSPYAADGKAIVKLAGITVAQAPEMIGYCWEATGLNVPRDFPNAPATNDPLFMMQNLSLLQHPQRGYAEPAAGFSVQPGIAYSMASADDGSGANFFIDPTGGVHDPDHNPAGGCHLRRVALTHAGPPPNFALGTNQSWGRFPLPIERYVVHPQGYVFGINLTAHKIYRVQLPSAAVPDLQAPLATMASGQGTRDGLIDGPVGLAVSKDGRLLVIESINNRVQAFDLCGTPVPFFRNPDWHAGDPAGTKKIPTLKLRSAANARYLDIAVESQGYIYVLYSINDGASPDDYLVDLYEPDGSFLVETRGVTAANIDVDILRNLFTLNYEVILDPAGRPQPSISMWLPPAPPPGT